MPSCMQTLVSYTAAVFLFVSLAIDGVMMLIWKETVINRSREDENKLSPRGLTNRQALLWKIKVIARWIGIVLMCFLAFTEFVKLARM